MNANSLVGAPSDGYAVAVEDGEVRTTLDVLKQKGPKKHTKTETGWLTVNIFDCFLLTCYIQRIFRNILKNWDGWEKGCVSMI